MKATALLRVGRNVADLRTAQKFYTEALGFQPIGAPAGDKSLAEMLGVKRVTILRMRLGTEEIELSECSPAGAPYPRQRHANDPCFQHIAIVTTDIAAAHERVMRHGAEPISTHGPVHLPLASGDVTAFKFRDPEGHPLELLQFPPGATKAQDGYDHSAIGVSDVEQSLAFYSSLGLALASRQINRGPEQDALDGLRQTAVDVVALRPPRPTPHVELLGYRRPRATATAPYAAADICADRLIFGTGGGDLNVLRDPDGHIVLLDARLG